MNFEAKRALNILLEGNQRFAASLSTHPHIDSSRRKECLSGQKPIAAIVGCSDSRVPPEIIFDCGIGDIFIIRLAGCFIDNIAIASVEYAVEHLDVPLVLVLGHSCCGAIKAAVTDKKENDALGFLFDKIREISKENSFTYEENNIDEITKKFTIHIANSLSKIDPIIKKSLELGKCSIVPAFYSLVEGKVTLL